MSPHNAKTMAKNGKQQQTTGQLEISNTRWYLMQIDAIKQNFLDNLLDSPHLHQNLNGSHPIVN